MAFFDLDDIDEDELGKSFLEETLQRIEDEFMGNPNLIRRNWYQVKDSNGVFAIGKLSASRSTVEGGTGWAVQMAVDSKKPVYVFDTVNSLWQS